MSGAATKLDEQDQEEKTQEPKKNRSGVVDYLSAPKKKRKNFIVLALGPRFDPDLSRAIGLFCKSQFPRHSVAVPKKKDEFLRQASRNLSLVIIDDQFLPLSELTETIKDLKEKKSDTNIPFLFLTQNSESLISEYNKSMLDYQDLDEYVELDKSSRIQLFARIKYGVDHRFQRRSRRFKMEIPIQFQVHKTQQMLQGTLLDLSVHGGFIRSAGGHVFSLTDQIRIFLPLSAALKERKDDVLRLTAKVRRVDIGGDRAGVSWEFMSAEKSNVITQFLFAIFEKFLSKSGAAMRAKVSKVPMPVGRPS